MGQMQTLEILELVASDQWGIVTTAQAKREGISRLQLGRLAEQGVIERARRGVYLLPSARRDVTTELKVAWVALDSSKYVHERWEAAPVIAVSHESAAKAHGIGNLIPQRYVFSSSERKQTTHSDIEIYMRQDLTPDDVQSLDGLPVTTVERTIADLAAKKIEDDYLATLIVDGLRKEGVRFATLAANLDPYAKHYDADSGEELLRRAQEKAAPKEDLAELVDRLDTTSVREVLGPARQLVEIQKTILEELDGAIAKMMAPIELSLRSEISSLQSPLRELYVELDRSISDLQGRLPKIQLSDELASRILEIEPGGVKSKGDKERD